LSENVLARRLTPYHVVDFAEKLFVRDFRLDRAEGARHRAIFYARAVRRDLASTPDPERIALHFGGVFVSDDGRREELIDLAARD
jgi:hypothetical protein